MRWWRKSRTPAVLTDYRQVGRVVRGRLREREQGPVAILARRMESQRGGREYRPNQRLSGICERVRVMEEHVRRTPRLSVQAPFGSEEAFESPESHLLWGFLMAVLAAFSSSLWRWCAMRPDDESSASISHGLIVLMIRLQRKPKIPAALTAYRRVKETVRARRAEIGRDSTAKATVVCRYPLGALSGDFS